MIPMKEMLITIIVIFLIGTPIVNIIDKPIEELENISGEEIEIIVDDLIIELEKDVVEFTGHTIEELENMSEEELEIIVSELKENNSEFEKFFEEKKDYFKADSLKDNILENLIKGFEIDMDLGLEEINFENLEFDNIRDILLQKMNEGLDKNVPNGEALRVYKKGLNSVFGEISIKKNPGEIALGMIDRMFEYIIADCFKMPEAYSSFPRISQ